MYQNCAGLEDVVAQKTLLYVSVNTTTAVNPYITGPVNQRGVSPVVSYLT